MGSGIREADRALIRETPLFSGISETQFEAILGDAAAKAMSRGETLFLQGDRADALFVVLEGWVKLYRVTPAGDEAVVHVFTDGQSFAEAAAFTGGVYPVSAEAGHGRASAPHTGEAAVRPGAGRAGDRLCPACLHVAASA